MFTIDKAAQIFPDTRTADAVPAITARYKLLSAEDQLAPIWFAYLEMGRTITVAAPVSRWIDVAQDRAGVEVQAAVDHRHDVVVRAAVHRSVGEARRRARAALHPAAAVSVRHVRQLRRDAGAHGRERHRHGRHGLPDDSQAA